MWRDLSQCSELRMSYWVTDSYENTFKQRFIRALGAYAFHPQCCTYSYMKYCVKTPFMVRLGSPRTEDESLNSVTYPFALSLVEGLLRVFTQLHLEFSPSHQDEIPHSETWEILLL